MPISPLIMKGILPISLTVRTKCKLVGKIPIRKFSSFQVVLSRRPVGVVLVVMTFAISIFILPAYAFDSEFILECSTWYESYLLTSKSEFILVWEKGAIDCFDMLDSWTGKLFLWHNDGLILDHDLIQAISYLKGSAVSQPTGLSTDEVYSSNTQEKLFLSPKSYRFGQPVTVTLIDPDLNQSGDVVDIFRVVNDQNSPYVDTVGSANGGILLEIKIKDTRYQRCTIDGIEHGGLASTGFTLIETGPSTGVFEGIFKIPSKICNKSGTDLITTAGGNIKLVYHDFRDSFGEQNIQTN